MIFPASVLFLSLFLLHWIELGIIRPSRLSSYRLSCFIILFKCTVLQGKGREGKGRYHCMSLMELTEDKKDSLLMRQSLLNLGNRWLSILVCV